jgi:hypothetical protein
MGLLGMNRGISGWHLSKFLNRFPGIHGVIPLLRIVWIGSYTISLIPCEFFPIHKLRENGGRKELMNRDKFGVSRLRVADGGQLPEGSSAVALTPIGTSSSCLTEI